MSDFKLLALRPLPNCKNKFLKNLEAGNFYKFYQDFYFKKDKHNSVNKIIIESEIPVDLYGKNISISAVVGKNGSGKSTIVEIFCAFVFCLSKELNLINIEAFKESHSLTKEDQIRLDQEVQDFEFFSCELYYQVEDRIFALIKTSNQFRLIRYQKTKISNEKKKIFELESDTRQLSMFGSLRDRNIFLHSSFFYSILANYSLYGLNTNETGIWLKSLFHKNDGYQAPIVLNPMRTKGIIDVNRITYLSKSRLLSNVFLELKNDQNEKESLRCLVNDKIVDKIILKLDLKKFTVVDENNLNKNQSLLYIEEFGDEKVHLDKLKKHKEDYKHDHFRLLIKAFYPNFDYNTSQLSNTKYFWTINSSIIGKV